MQCLRFRPAKSISHGNFASPQDAHANGHGKRDLHADDAPYFNARLSRKCPEHDALTNISHSDASTIERYANDGGRRPDTKPDIDPPTIYAHPGDPDSDAYVTAPHASSHDRSRSLTLPHTRHRPLASRPRTAGRA